MKNYIYPTLLFFITFLFIFSGCGDNQSQNQKFSKISYSGESAGVDSGTRVNIGVVQDRNSFVALANPANYFTNFNADPPPSCGPIPVPFSCKRSDTSSAALCRSESAQVQRDNLRQGFYLKKIDNYPYCRKRCMQKMPKSQGIKIAYDVLTYLAKGFLELTQACHWGCQEAISQNKVFPVECKNVADNPNRIALVEKISEAQEKLNNDPEYIEASNKLALVKAGTLSIENRINALKLAEENLKNYLEHVYPAEHKAAVNRIKDIDTKILNLLADVGAQLGRVQKPATEAQALLLSGKANSQNLREARLALANVRGESCNTYGFSSLLVEANASVKNFSSVNKQLMTKVLAVSNPNLTTKTGEKIAEMERTIVPQPIPADLLDGSFPKKICEHYKRIARASEIAQGLEEISATSTEILEIIAQLDAALAEGQKLEDGAAFRRKLLNQAQVIAVALRNATTSLQWNKATHLAIDGSKILYIGFLPGITLNNNLTPEQKDRLKSEVKNIIGSSVIDWNKMANKYGMIDIVKAHRSKIETRFQGLRSRLANNSALGDNIKVNLISHFPLLFSPDFLNINELPSGENEIILFEDSLTQFETQLKNIFTVLEGGEK